MTTTIVNDALVKIDYVVTAAEYLLEEMKTRQDGLLSEEAIAEKVRTIMDDYDFRMMVLRYLKDEYAEGLCREVAFFVMQKIDNDIEAFINDRVAKALEAQTRQ